MIAIPITLQEFLTLPNIEESPAWEYIDGVVQKPMGGGKHSRLQKRLVAEVDGTNSGYEAFPELRCTFGDRSLVPDIVILATNNIPVDENGEISSTGIEFAPDWVIEILSPHQSQTKVICKILHCLKHGSRLGWLLDPSERLVLVYQRDCLPELLANDEILPTLEEVELNLPVNQIFSSLQRTL